MRRTTPLLVLFPLAFALGACGDDGGGGDAAFCDVIEELEGVDQPTVDDIEEAADAAPSELEDQMEILVDAARAFEEFEEDGDESAFDDLDEEEFEQAAEDVEDFARDECDIDLDSDATSDDDSDDDADDSTTTTEAEDAETTTTEADGDGGDDDSGTGDLEAGEPDEPPSLDDPELDALAQECFEGSGEACDDLFFQTDAGSPEEEYGNTCGGRFDESPGFCSDAIGG